MITSAEVISDLFYLSDNHRASSDALFLYYHIQYHPQQLKSILIFILYPNFCIPQFISLFPCFPSIFHHFSLLLFIHLLHCGKCGKLCGKLSIFTYKYPKITINKRKIPINTPKSYQDIPFVFLFLVLLLGFTPYILGTHGSHTLLCPKRLSVFSPRPLTSFGSPSNRFSFIEPTVLK